VSRHAATVPEAAAPDCQVRYSVGVSDPATPWLFALPPAVEAAFLPLATARRYHDGELIHGRGDRPDGLYHVVRGKIRISGVSAGGRELLLTMLEPGSWFGEISLIDGLPRTHDAHAVGDTELRVVSPQAFEAVVAGQPGLLRELMRLLCARLRLSLGALEDAMLLPAPARLAKRLLGAPVGASGGVDLPQEQLARLVATSRQSVSGIVKAWERAGWVSVSYGQIVIRDRAALARLVAEAEET
jgi:CRP/FNR family cyclic AMP-dependent transcriptional regulator